MGSRFQGSKMARVLAFFAFLIHSSLGCGAVNERSRRSTALPDHGERSLLHRDLMEGYEKDVIPMEAAPNADNDADAVVFNLGASVIRMDMKNLESNELKPVLEMTSWLRMSWMDFRLKWNPEAYGGISQIRLPASKVWIPDIEVFSAVNFGPDSYSQRMAAGPGHVVVYSSGFVLYIPAVDIQLPCSKNSKDYSCHMKMGSWTYDAFHLGLTPFDNKTHLDLENVQRESPYLITSQDGDAKKTKFYDCCKEPYPAMEYKFTVRKSSALPAPIDDYFASYKTDMLVTSNPKTTKLRGY